MNIVNIRNTVFTALIFSSLITFSPESHAYVNDESGTEIGYDTIVSELSKSRRKAPKYRSQKDPFSMIKIHTGIGAAQSFTTVRTSSGNVQGFHRGIQASLGIDLFSQNWFAESSIRSFGQANFEDNISIQLREFDLKIIYKSNSQRLFGYRAGIGLAARNLKLIENGTEKNDSTPASILLVGMDTNISKTFSIGSEVSYRSAVIDESADRSSFDISLKLDAHF